MLSFKLNNECLECGSVEQLLKDIDRKLAHYGKSTYHRITKGSIECVDPAKISDLVMYKHILLHLQQNQQY